MGNGRNFVRWTLLATAAGAAIFFFWGRRYWSPKTEVRVSCERIRLSNFPFHYEHWKEERLFQLRNQENFPEILGRNQFEYFLKLCDWTHRQWQRSVPDPYPLSNAIDILADIRSRKTGGFCGQYAYVLADVLKSLGFFAVRYVELWNNSGESHFVVEAWSDQHQKWAILDPDNNLFYEIEENGRPAAALEVRDSLFGGKPVRAKMADRPGESLGRKKVDLYANFAISLRSDLMRHRRPLTVGDRFEMFLFFRDDHTDRKIFNGRIPYANVTSRREDIDYGCNQVRVEYRLEGRDVMLSFFTDGSMPNFRCFMVSLDNGKKWQRSDDRYRIPYRPGPLELWISPLNWQSRFGSVTRANVLFH